MKDVRIIKNDPKLIAKVQYKTNVFKLNLSILQNNDMFTVKGGRPLMNILIGMFRLSGAGITTGRILMICDFLRNAKTIQRSQGVKGLVIFLKAAHVLIQQSIGGMKVKDAGKLGVRLGRTRKGLPRFLPIVIRRLIAKGDPITIKLALTLCAMYRVLEFPGTLKLNTITAPNTGHGGLNKQIYSFIPLFVKRFISPRFSKDFLLARLNQYSNENLFSMFKGGPGVKGTFGEWNTMPYILIRSLSALMSSKTLWHSIEELFDYMPLPNVQHAIRVACPVFECVVKGKPLVSPIPYLGKLGMKSEAAGKIRVFAMVDAWTQWILYPLHKLIFMIISGIKMDGTFNQLEPIQHLLKSKQLYSLDLTAATDRIPLALQKRLLAEMITHQFAGAWANLLVGRTYRIHGTEKKEKYLDLKYAVGQPMGALSSWAMLALVHHFLVQISAWRAGWSKDRLYTNYAILGDDLVIGDKAVMLQYLEILASLGVQCGLHKSLISPRGLALEFAKRTFFKGIDVSPIPVLEFAAGNKSFGAFKELTKKYNVSLATALNAYGVGWKIRSWLNKPIGKLSSRMRTIVLTFNVPTDEEGAKKFFELGAPANRRWTNEIHLIMKQFAKVEISRLIRKLLLMSNSAVNQDSVDWGRETSASIILDKTGFESLPHSGEGLAPTFGWFQPKSKGPNVSQLTLLTKTGELAMSDIKYPFRLLADSLTNLSNCTWHAAKIQVVKEAQVLKDELFEITNAESASTVEVLERDTEASTAFVMLKDSVESDTASSLLEFALGFSKEVDALKDQIRSETAKATMSDTEVPPVATEANTAPPKDVPSADDLEFQRMYIAYLRINREINSMDNLTFSKVRPNPPVVKGLLDSVQVRMWKRWSKVLQGSTKIETTS
jgi:hypothetical protein